MVSFGKDMTFKWDWMDGNFNYSIPEANKLEWGKTMLVLFAVPNVKLKQF